MNRSCRLAVRDERDGVVKAASFSPGKRDDQGGPGRAFAFEGIERLRRGFDERRAEHQVLGRVTDQHQLGKDDEIRAKAGGLDPGHGEQSRGCR